MNAKATLLLILVCIALISATTAGAYLLGRRSAEGASRQDVEDLKRAIAEGNREFAEFQSQLEGSISEIRGTVINLQALMGEGTSTGEQLGDAIGGSIELSERMGGQIQRIDNLARAIDRELRKLDSTRESPKE